MATQTENQTTERGRADVDAQPKYAASVAREALEASDGTIQNATELLFNRVTNDREFIAEKLPEIVRAWCAAQIGGLVGSRRLAAWRPPNYDPKGNGARVASLESTLLLDFPLPGGKRLGDADSNEVLEGATVFRQQADDMAWKARWLTKVAAKVGNKPRVADALTEAELRKMQEAARAH